LLLSQVMTELDLHALDAVTGGQALSPNAQGWTKNAAGILVPPPLILQPGPALIRPGGIVQSVKPFDPQKQ